MKEKVQMTHHNAQKVIHRNRARHQERKEKQNPRHQWRPERKYTQKSHYCRWILSTPHIDHHERQRRSQEC